MNIVRGAGNIAGNIVDGTVNAVATVASVATGGLGGQSSGSGSFARRHSSMDGRPNVVLKDKVTMTIKSTPERSAQGMASLAVKSGAMLKRNEQGVWQKRFCCLVPHLFLYYFDGDGAKDPQGVIDMEFLTDISVQSDNIIKIASPEDSLSRVFYFQADSSVLGNQWASVMQRERYAVVRDERDAYQQLQDQFSGQLDFAFQQVEITSAERDRLQAELNKLIKDQDEIEFILKKFALIIGMSESEIPSSAGLARCVEALLAGVERLKASYDTKIASDAEIRKQEQSTLYDKIEILESQQSEAAHSIRYLEASVLQEKRDAEIRLKDSVAEIARLNAVVEQMQVDATEAEGKLLALLDQKKVLVKEVKAMRKKEQSSDEIAAQLAQSNEELKRTVAGLTAQLEEMRLSHQTALRDAVSSASAAAAAAAVGSTVAEGTGLLPTRRNSLNLGASDDQASARSSADVSSSLASPGHSTNSPRAAGASSDTTLGDTGTKPATPVEGLSESGTSAAVTAAQEESSISRFMPSLTLFSKDKTDATAGHSGSGHAHSSGIGNPKSTDKDSSSISLHLPSLTFFSSNSSSGATTSSSSSGGSNSNGTGSGGSTGSSIFSSLTFSLDSDSSSSSKTDVPHNSSSGSTGGSLSAPRCYRCGGTVEGPKYSTCKCAVPAMTPEEAAPPVNTSGSNRLGGFSGLLDMFGKSKDPVGIDASTRSSGPGAVSSSIGSGSGAASSTSPSPSPVGSSVFQAQLVLDDEEGGGHSPVKRSASGGNGASTSPTNRAAESTNLLDL